MGLVPATAPSGGTLSAGAESPDPGTTRSSAALDGLPEVFERLAPDLGSLFPAEPLATCEDCAMKPRAVVESSWAPEFPAISRCCTYHPELPNFLCGRALRRGGPGADAIRARIGQGEGVSPGGIRSTRAYRQRYAEGGFGLEQALTCPYWSASAPEGRGCSIHLDREAVCRTWHCRLAGGARGYAAWMALKELLAMIEYTLVQDCLDRAGQPPGDDATVEGWEAWYRRCADHVDRIDVERLRGEALDQRRAEIASRAEERDLPLPAVVGPTIHDWCVHPHGVTLISWSRYDPVEAPPWIFRFLARLDGQTPWRRAKADTEAELGLPVPDDLVLLLFRRGLLGPPEHLGAKPGLTVVPLWSGSVDPER